MPDVFKLDQGGLTLVIDINDIQQVQKVLQLGQYFYFQAEVTGQSNPKTPTRAYDFEINLIYPADLFKEEKEKVKSKQIALNRQALLNYPNAERSKADMVSVSQSGLVNITFSRHMDNFTDFCINSQSKQWFTYSQLIEHNRQLIDIDKIEGKLIKVWIEPSDFNEEDQDKLRFTWNLTQFNSTELNIQLEFEHPKYVSSTPESDFIFVEILAPEWFVDQERHMPLSNQTLILSKALPQQSDSQTQEFLDQIKQALIFGQSTVFGLTGLSSYFLGASLQMLFDIIKAL